MTAESLPNAIPAVSDPVRVWLPRLLRIMDEQTELYTRLDQQSQTQDGLLQDEDSGRLLALLAERQAVVDQITDCNHLLEPFRRHWEELSSALDEPQRAQINERLDRLEGLVAAITARDEDTRRVLEARKSSVTNQLQAMTRVRSAVSAYGNQPTGAAPRYQDHEA